MRVVSNVLSEEQTKVYQEFAFFNSELQKIWNRDENNIATSDSDQRKRTMRMTHVRLLLAILVVGVMSMVHNNAKRMTPVSTRSSGASYFEAKEVHAQRAEPSKVTVGWTSVDPGWGRQGDMAHYITTKAEPIISVRALRDVSSIEFSACSEKLHHIRAVAEHSANIAGALHLVASTPVFLVVDNDYESAFVHWVTESSVFLHYWSELHHHYPNLKLWVRNKKDYKKLMAALYGIGPERIVTGKLPLPNLILFPPLQRQNTDRMDFMLFVTLVDKHVSRIRSAAKPFKQDDIPILILPRQSKENFEVNDRTVPGYDVLGKWATRIGGKVLNTDEMTSMGEQSSLVLASKVIVLDYGSSLFFNGLIARNSTILVIGNLHNHDCLLGLNCSLGPAHIFLKILSNGNSIHFIPPGDVSAIRNIVPSLPD